MSRIDANMAIQAARASGHIDFHRLYDGEKCLTHLNESAIELQARQFTFSKFKQILETVDATPHFQSLDFYSNTFHNHLISHTEAFLMLVNFTPNQVLQHSNNKHYVYGYLYLKIYFDTFLKKFDLNFNQFCKDFENFHKEHAQFDLPIDQHIDFSLQKFLKTFYSSNLKEGEKQKLIKQLEDFHFSLSDFTEILEKVSKQSSWMKIDFNSDRFWDNLHFFIKDILERFSLTPKQILEDSNQCFELYKFVYLKICFANFFEKLYPNFNEFQKMFHLEYFEIFFKPSLDPSSPGLYHLYEKFRKVFAHPDSLFKAISQAFTRPCEQLKQLAQTVAQSFKGPTEEQVFHLLIKNRIDAMCLSWKQESSWHLKAIREAEKKLEHFELDLNTFSIKWTKTYEIIFQKLDKLKTDVGLDRFNQILNAYGITATTPEETIVNALDALFEESKTCTQSSQCNQLAKISNTIWTALQNNPLDISFEKLDVYEEIIKAHLQLDPPALQDMLETIASFREEIHRFKQAVQIVGKDLSDEEFSALVIKIFQRMYEAKDENENPLNPESRKWILKELFVYWTNECQDPFIEEMASAFITTFKGPSLTTPSTIKNQLLQLKRNLNKRTLEIFKINQSLKCSKSNQQHSLSPIEKHRLKQITAPLKQLEERIGKQTIRFSLLRKLNAVPKFRKSFFHYQQNRVNTLNAFVQHLPQYIQEVEKERETAFEKYKDRKARLIQSKNIVYKGFKLLPIQKIFESSFENSLFSKRLFMQNLKTHQMALLDRVFHSKDMNRENLRFKKSFIKAQKRFRHACKEICKQKAGDLKRRKKNFIQGKNDLIALFKKGLRQTTQTLDKTWIAKFFHHVAQLIDLFKTLAQKTPIKKILKNLRPIEKGYSRCKSIALNIFEQVLEKEINEKQLRVLAQAMETACKEFESKLKSRLERLSPKKEEMPLPPDLNSVLQKHHSLLEELDLIRQFIAQTDTNQNEGLSPIFVDNEDELRQFFQQVAL